jgi:hypothetical protein
MIAVLPTAVATLALGAPLTETVVEDHFDYADSAALWSAWTQVDGAGRAHCINLVTNNTLRALNADGTAQINTTVAHPSAPYLSMSNGLVRRDLSKNLTDDWNVSFRAIFDASGTSGRGTWVGLMNAAGTQGYILMWELTKGTDYTLNQLSIRKINVASEITGWTPATTTLGSQYATGVSAQLPADGTGDLASFSLGWSASTEQEPTHSRASRLAHDAAAAPRTHSRLQAVAKTRNAATSTPSRMGMMTSTGTRYCECITHSERRSKLRRRRTRRMMVEASATGAFSLGAARNSDSARWYCSKRALSEGSDARCRWSWSSSPASSA